MPSNLVHVYMFDVGLYFLNSDEGVAVLLLALWLICGLDKNKKTSSLTTDGLQRME